MKAKVNVNECQHDKRLYSLCPDADLYRHKEQDLILKKINGVVISVPVERKDGAKGKFPLDLAAYARAHPAQGEWDETFQEMLSRTGKEQKTSGPVPAVRKVVGYHDLTI